MWSEHRSHKTVILKLLNSNINLQFVTGVYAMVTCLTPYLFKPKHGMSEFMKEASKEAYGKEAYGKDIKDNMFSIGNTFLAKREVSTHEAIKTVLTLPMKHSNIDVLYVPTSLKNNISFSFRKMHPDDTNVFASNIIEKYEN